MYEKLFEPIKVGNVVMANRIVLPPLTRSRSSQPGNIPNSMMAEYYRQRSSAGLMITEATQIEPRGQGYAWTPGIHTEAQKQAWKQIADEVHAAGTPIFMQLWHVGRVSHHSLQPNGDAPVAPSAIRADNVKVFIETGVGEGALTDPDLPRELTIEEIKEIIELYTEAAISAVEAGFDGVEIHAANGYLINQFISEHTNKRTDQYGGSLRNRLRFLDEVVSSVANAIGKEKTAVRFAPLFESTQEERVYLGLVESDPQQTYIEAIKLVNNIGIAYLSIAEADWNDAPELPKEFYEAVRNSFSNPIMYAGKYTPEKALKVMENGWGDIFGFGRSFIANPDLPERILNNYLLNDLDSSTLFGGGEKGYLDYPRY